MDVRVPTPEQSPGLLDQISGVIFEGTFPQSWQMAALISPGLAMTVDHVLPSDLSPGGPFSISVRFPRRRSRRIEGPSLNPILEPPEEDDTSGPDRGPQAPVATVNVAERHPAFDLALLGVRNIGTRLSSSTFHAGKQLSRPTDAVLVGADPPPGSAWECLCFTPGQPDGVVAHGTVQGVEEIEKIPHIALKVEGGPSPSQGISGAPVVVDGCVVGLIARAREDDSAWYAVPVAPLLAKVGVPIRQLGGGSTTNVASKAGGVVPAPDDLRRFSGTARKALSHAAGIMQARSDFKLRIEYLIAALYETPGSPLPALLNDRNVSGDALYRLVSGHLDGYIPPPPEVTPAALTSMPPCSAYARQSIEEAQRLANAGRGGTVRVVHLLAGVLSVKEAGVAADLLKQGLDATALLKQERARTVVGVSSDSADATPTDLLGIETEVETLCSVIAARGVEPPLSIGLFGDWGSGKSFFMGKMWQRIAAFRDEARVAAKRGEPESSPYCAHVVQLRFNAWHYIDTNLWASLAAEIFEGLAAALPGECDGTSPEEVRARLRAATSGARDALAAAEQEKAKAETALATLDEKLSPKELFGAALAAASPAVRQQADAVAEKLKFSGADEGLAKLRENIRHAETVSASVRATWMFLRKHPVFGLFCLAGAVAAPWVTTWLARNQGEMARIGAAVVGFFGTVAAVITPFWKPVRTALAGIDAIRARVSEEEEKRREVLEKQKGELERRRQEAEERVAETTRNLKEVEQRLAESAPDGQLSRFLLERSRSTDYSKHFGVIAQARNDFEVLCALLTAARAAGPKGAKGDDGNKQEREPFLPPVERIILYIDDLDRCPESKVVDVLQAVHLLLAFPLFVVVVGVDPRWLLHSLKHHLRPLREGGGVPEPDDRRRDRSADPDRDGESDDDEAQWQTTPLNYLEKIFQIPFTLRPIGEGGFAAMIDELTADGEKEGRSTAHGRIASNDQTAGVPIRRTDVAGVAAVAASTGPAATAVEARAISNVGTDQGRVQQTQQQQAFVPEKAKAAAKPAPPVDLTIDESERRFMKKLWRFIPSPRAAKRFVNVYRLLRAGVDEEERLAFADEEEGGHRVVLTLLAVLTGYPSEASDVLGGLLESPAERTWKEYVDRFARRVEGADAAKGPGTEDAGEAERWKELLAHLREIEGEVGGRGLSDFVDWAPRVARYSFYSGRVLLAQRSSRREGPRVPDGGPVAQSHVHAPVVR